MLILAILIAFTAQDIKNAKCDVGCKRSGYSSGTYSNNQCYCFDSFPYESFVNEKRIVIPRKKSSKDIWF